MASSNFSCTGLNITATYTGEGTCTTTLVAESAGGTPMSGTFSLTILSDSNDDDTDEAIWETSKTTAYLTYNATSAEVQAALEGLDDVATADVELINSLSGSRGGGSTYLITFPGASGSTSIMGGLSLTASAAGLNGTGMSATVREVYPGSRWGGEFALSVGGLESSALQFDADAEDVREAVDALVSSAGGKEGEVAVWREEIDAGFRWAVAFSAGDLDGDIDLMEVGSGFGGGSFVCNGKVYLFAHAGQDVL